MPKMQEIFLSAAALLWLIIILSEYSSTYLNTDILWANFSFWGLSIGFVLAALGLAFGMPKLRFRPNGFMLYAVFVLLSLLILRSVLAAYNMPMQSMAVFAKHYLVNPLLVLLIVAAAHNWGTALLSLSVFRQKENYVWPLRVATGIVLLTLYLFIVSAVGGLNVFTALPVYLSLFVFYKQSLQFLKNLFWKPLGVDMGFIGWLTGSMLVLFVAINYLNLMRPIPTGFDALSLYLNLSHLIAEGQTLISGYQPYNWSVFMSLGYLLSANSSLALSLALLGGLLTLSAVYHLARLWLKPDYALAAAALLYSLPGVVFQSYKDMKTDMGLLFMLLCATIAFVCWLRQSYKKRAEDYSYHWWRDHRWLWLCGGLLGFGLGIKFTTYFLIAAVICTLAYRFGKWLGGLSMFAFILGATLVIHLDEMSGLRQYQNGVEIWQWLLTVLGLGGLVYTSLKNRSKMLRLLPAVAAVTAACMLVFSPWLFKNIKESQPVTGQKLLFGERFFPNFDLTKTLTVQPQAPPNNAIVENNTAAADPATQVDGWEETGVQEEVQRYIGYERGLLKYASIPYDMSFGTHVNGLQNNVGYLYLFLLPLLLMVWYKRATVWNTLIWLSAFLFYGMYRLTASAQQAALAPTELSQADLAEPAGGFLAQLFAQLAFIIHQPFSALKTATPSLIYPALLLVFLAAFFALDRRLPKDRPRPLRVLTVSTFVYACLWVLLSGGIVWYGLWLFAMLAVFTMIWLQDVQKHTAYLKYVAWFGLGSWLFLATMMRMSSYDNDPSFQRFGPVIPSFLKYMSGNIPDDGKIFKHMSPAVQDAIDILNNDKDVRIYRVGTTYNFFINRNNERVRDDNQLDLFNNIYMHHQGNISAMHQSFVANGYKYLLIDLNTANIDITEERSLEKKFNSLMNFMQQNQNMRLIATDRVVRNANGENQYALYGETMVYGGTFALYQVE